MHADLYGFLSSLFLIYTGADTHRIWVYFKAYAILVQHNLRGGRDLAELMSLREPDVGDCRLGLRCTFVAATDLRGKMTQSSSLDLCEIS